MKNIAKKINQILAEWNPLEVGDNVSFDEYVGFVPQIIKYMDNKEDLTNCLEDILINDLEVGYDRKNENHKKMIAEVIEKIIQLNNL